MSINSSFRLTINNIISFSQFLFSVVFLIPEIWRGNVHCPPKKTLVFFAIPAFLYFISNNTAVHVQVYLDPASFQVSTVLQLFCFFVGGGVA